MSKNCILFALVFATIAAFAPVAKAVYCPEPTTGGRWPYYCYRQQQCQIWYAGTSVPTWEYSTDVVASNLGGAGSPIVSCGCAEKYMNNNDLQWLVNNAGYHWVTGGGVSATTGTANGSAPPFRKRGMGERQRKDWFLTIVGTGRERKLKEADGFPDSGKVFGGVETNFNAGRPSLQN
ncbi:hypothetical protein BJ742DRAFT_912546 [Cladochytrium replicatum]|nr:hypothetical protein BJ742DRAFT_912546 [Cladochytrium replicatum]